MPPRHPKFTIKGHYPFSFHTYSNITCEEKISRRVNYRSTKMRTKKRGMRFCLCPRRRPKGLRYAYNGFCGRAKALEEAESLSLVDIRLLWEG